MVMVLDRKTGNATNKLDDRFDASPALVDGEIYLRGYKDLYCVAAQ